LPSFVNRVPVIGIAETGRDGEYIAVLDECLCPVYHSRQRSAVRSKMLLPAAGCRQEAPDQNYLKN
jgi:hypothetical protein